MSLAAEGELPAGSRSQLGFAPSGAWTGDGHGWRTEVHRRQTAADEFRAMVGDRIFFAPGSSEIGGRARAVLKAQAEWLKRYPAIVVTIEGHADDPGSVLDNRVLAERRAEAVRRRLVEEGATPGRIKLVAHGGDRPVALCGEAVCAAQNRRAVSVLDAATVTSHAASGRTKDGDDRARGRLPR